MLVHCTVTPSIKLAGTHLYTWVERSTARIKFLAQEHDTVSPARAQTWTARSEVQCNNEGTGPPTGGEEDRPVITRASVGNKPESKNASCFSWATNGGSWFQVAAHEETGNENCFSLVIVCLLFVNNIIYIILCFVKKALERIMPYTLISQGCGAFS